jgi:hypothetical protein
VNRPLAIAFCPRWPILRGPTNAPSLVLQAGGPTGNRPAPLSKKVAARSICEARFADAPRESSSTRTSPETPRVVGMNLGQPDGSGGDQGG